MALNIEKRVRALATDNWGAWTITTDAPPYTDTNYTDIGLGLAQYRVASLTDINIADFTNGSAVAVDDGFEWEGTGVFDVLMKAVNGNVRVEFDSGRITGPDYATVYLGSIQTAIQSAMQFLLQKQQTEAQTDTAREQKNLLLKQQLLVERQTKGFDDDAKQKLLKQTLDSWSVAYSVAQDSNSIPDTIKVNVIDSIMKDAYTNLGIAVTNDPIGEQ